MTKDHTPDDSKKLEESVKECGCDKKEQVPQQDDSEISKTLDQAPDPANADGTVKKQATQANYPKEMTSKKKMIPKDDGDDDGDEDEDEEDESIKAKIAGFEKMYNEQQLKIAALEAQLKGTATSGVPKPTAMIASDKEGIKNWEQLAMEAKKSIKEHGHFSFDVDLDPIYKEMCQKTYNYANPYFNKMAHGLTETFSTSGTIPGVDIDRDFLLLPGGTYMKPIRQYTRFAVVPQGTDRTRFFTSTIPASATQTAGTTATDSTYTLTSVEVVPSTITGNVNTINTNNLEDFPTDIIKATTQAAVARMMDFEADQVFDVTAGAATPGEWIRADTSATITSDDLASITMTASSISEARKFLELKGYPVDRLCCALAPQQYKELINDTNITRYIQANLGLAANISTTGIVERYLGVELLVTNKVQYSANTTNHALRAVCFVKNWTWALGVKRDLTIKMHEFPEANDIVVTASWRVAAATLDATSFVRISTTTTQAGQNG